MSGFPSHDPEQMDDYSANAAGMQVQTNPGESGSESLPTTLAGELERLRFIINEMKGTTYWYETQTWTTPTFDAGDYTGNNSMTWTVASGDVSTMAYVIDSEKMTVAFRILTTTVGGTPSTQLQIAIPASKTATKAMMNACYLVNNGTAAIGFVRVDAAGTDIIIQLVNSGNWAASTDNTNVIGQITFEID